MGARKGAEVVPEGFLEEEARLRHLVSACSGTPYEPWSQPWTDTLSVCSLSGGLFFILQHPAQPSFPLPVYILPGPRMHGVSSGYYIGFFLAQGLACGRV